MVRGRPRRFDRDSALQGAMEVFWAKGYEGTQITDLTAAIGINPPSFYAAFESKEAVFLEAVDLYLSTVGEVSMRALSETAKLTAAIEAMLLASVKVALSNPATGGCMVSLGMVNCQLQHARLHQHMRDLRNTTCQLVRQRLERGVADRELPAGTDVERLATFFSTILQGISLQAQDGATSEELVGIAQSAMRVLNDPPMKNKP